MVHYTGKCDRVVCVEQIYSIELGCCFFYRTSNQCSCCHLGFSSRNLINFLTQADFLTHICMPKLNSRLFISLSQRGQQYLYSTTHYSSHQQRETERKKKPLFSLWESKWFGPVLPHSSSHWWWDWVSFLLCGSSNATWAGINTWPGKHVTINNWLYITAVSDCIRSC